MYLFSDIAVFCLIRVLSYDQKQRDTRLPKTVKTS